MTEPSTQLASAPPSTQDQEADAAFRDILGLRLNALTETPRFMQLNKMESYYRCTQYDGMLYDWDGRFQSYGGAADIEPGWYVPLKRRKPATRWELARAIVTRLTALLFGRDKWPEVTVEGDEEAEDYVKELIKASRIQARCLEARSLGGAEGTVCMGFAFIKGRPRVQVHNAKHCTVLAWEDPDELRVACAIKCYSYKRSVIEEGKIKAKDYYYVRYWDKNQEIEWDPIPCELGNQPGWASRVAYKRVVHGWDLCPFYWIQNLPNSESADGESDFEGQCDAMDETNRLLSATSKGTIANVDPTLVIKADPETNSGSIRKGSGSAIYAPGGAEYLEISGSAVTASMELLRNMRASILETAQVVIPDPDQVSASKGISGEALRMIYAPMLSKADVLREQYGNTLKMILTDMLNAARLILSRPPIPVEMPDGTIALNVPMIDLPPRIVPVTEAMEPTGTGRATREVPRTPGTSNNVALNWNPYFPYTWDDVQKAVVSAQTAAGGKPVASHKTAVKLIAPMTGVENIDAELAAIEADAEVAMDRQQRAFAVEAEHMGSMKTDPAKDDDAEDDDQKPGIAADE